MKKVLLCLLVMILASEGIHAQSLSETWMTSDSLHIYFPQNISVLNPSFRDNGGRLSLFTENFHKMKETPGSKVRSVLIVSGASPEGRIDINRHLSDSRAEAVLDFMVKEKLLDPSEIEVESRGIDWTGLANLVKESEMPYRDDVLRIISGPETDENAGKRQSALMQLDGGKVWEYMYEKYFPNLRGTMVMIIWDIKRESKKVPTPKDEQAPQPEPEPQPEPVPVEPVPEPQPETVVSKPEWSLNMAVKTNLLYDGMLIPNVGIEFGLVDGLVLNVEYMHNIWLRSDYSHWYRVHGAEFGLKYYINDEHRPFASGHHVGASAQMLTFDVTGILADADPWKFGPMLTYGYTLPIRKRLNLDFEVGAGVIFGDIHKYDAVDHLRILRKTDKAAFVPKAGVTLQYLIGKNNHNKKGK